MPAAAFVARFGMWSAAPHLVYSQYAVSNDGQRFLFIRPRPSSNARPPITVVVNWATELKK